MRRVRPETDGAPQCDVSLTWPKTDGVKRSSPSEINRAEASAGEGFRHEIATREGGILMHQNGLKSLSSVKVATQANEAEIRKMAYSK